MKYFSTLSVKTDDIIDQPNICVLNGHTMSMNTLEELLLTKNLGVTSSIILRTILV